MVAVVSAVAMVATALAWGAAPAQADPLLCEFDPGDPDPIAVFSPDSGDWTTAANWSTAAVPTGGRICIPAGRTAQLANTTATITDAELRVDGLLQIFFSGTLVNGDGATVDVGADGLVQIGGFGTFDNAGGTIDVTAGGEVVVSGTDAMFRHGVGADPGGGDPPAQGTIVGGAVRIGNGTIDLVGTGAGDFDVVDNNAFARGTLAPAQTIRVRCSGASNASLLFLASPALRNEGTIEVGPRAVAGTCVNTISGVNGATMQNAGTLRLGGAASPTDPTWIEGVTAAGTIVNEAGGSIVVEGHTTAVGATIVNDGDLTVTETGVLVTWQTSSVLIARDGTVNNLGTIDITGGAAYRVVLGEHTGNPIDLSSGGRFEPAGPAATHVRIRDGELGFVHNPLGPIVVQPDHVIEVSGIFDTVNGVSFENFGRILLAGRGDQSTTFSATGAGGIVTNHGEIRLTTTPGTGTGGAVAVSRGITNTADGLVAIEQGRPGVFTGAGIVNGGRIEVDTSSAWWTVVTLQPTSHVRVRSSASELVQIYALLSGSTLGGTLEVLTDPLDPPAPGEPRVVVDVRRNSAGIPNVIAGQFATLQGAAFATGRAYELSYASFGAASLQVVEVAGGVSVDDVAAPATATVADDIDVTWTVDVAAAGPTVWTETLLLSPTAVPDGNAIVLGTLTRSGVVAEPATLDGALTVRVPSATPGPWYLAVAVDLTPGVIDPARPTASTPIQIGATSLTVAPETVGSPITFAVDASGTRVDGEGAAVIDGTRLIRLDGASGRDVVITAHPPGAVEVLAASGRAPTTADHDAAGVAGTVVVPRGDGVAERYVRLRTTGSSPVTVAVSAVAPDDLVITSSSPTAVLAGAPAPTAVTVIGAGFTPLSTARLQCGAIVVNALTTQVIDPTRLIAQFDLPTALGDCQVRVGSATSPNLLRVSAPTVPVDPTTLAVEIRVIGPSIVRSTTDTTVRVEWVNRTAYSMPAPLFELRGVNARLRHVGEPGFGAERMLVLGIADAGPAGLLAPGAGGGLDIIVNPGGGATAEILIADADRATPYDIGAALASVTSPELPDAARAWVAANGPTIIGASGVATVGDYERHLGAVATTLSGLGRRVSDPIQLLRFDLQSVTAGGRLDAFASGEFGVGTPGLGTPRLVEDTATGAIRLIEGARSVRFDRFANGSYTGPSTSGALLVDTAAGWALRSRDGSRLEFDAAGRITRRIDASGGTRLYHHDPSGRLVAVDDPRWGTLEFEYDAAGRITTITDDAGRESDYEYDPQGRLVSATAGGLISTTMWGTNNLPISRTASDGVTRSVSRDSFGRIVAISVEGEVTATVTYGPDGSTTISDALGRSATRWVDDLGVVARVVDPLGRITTVRRDDRGEPVGLLADGAPIGDLVVTDATGRIRQAEDGSGASSLLSTTFDGFLRTFTDPNGATTRIERDGARRIVAVTDPAGAVTSLGYDADGRLSRVTDRTGTVVTRTFDGGRVASLDVEPVGDAATEHQYVYDVRGNLIEASGPAGTTTWTYDAHDRVATVRYPTGAGADLAYDGFGRPVTSTLVDPDGNDVRSTSVSFDARGRIATSRVDGQVVATYSYDALDRIIAVAHANGMRREIVRDPLGRVVRDRTTCCTAGGTGVGATVISDTVLAYDGRDRVVSRTDTRGATSSTTAYSYDAAGRLISAVTTGSGARTVTYSYDAAGNRTSVVDSVEGTSLASIDPVSGRPTIIGGAAVVHDAAGRRVELGDTVTTWTGLGQLRQTTDSAGSTTYTYDALGTPIAVTTDGTTRALVVEPRFGSFLLGEFDVDTGDLVAGYTWANGLVARFDDAAPADHYVADPRGDVVALVDSGGSTTDTWQYLPYGEVAERTGATRQPFQFQGARGPWTDARGLVHTPARVLDPTTGRFLTDDPVLLAAVNPASWAAGDPVNRTDVSGRLDEAVSLSFDVAAPGLAAPAGPFSPALTTGAFTQDDLFVGDPDRPSIDAVELAPREAVHTVQQGSTRPESPRLADPDDVAPAGAAPGADLVGSGVGRITTRGDDDRPCTEHDEAPFFGRLEAVRSTATTNEILVEYCESIHDMRSDVVDNRSRIWRFPTWTRVDPTVIDGPWGPDGFVLRPGAGWGGQILIAFDPNAIVGPAGPEVLTPGPGAPAGARYVTGDAALPYTILFENLPTADLPAATVVVTHELDADLDLATFSLGSVTIAGRTWAPPAGVTFWEDVLDDTDRSGFDVRIVAGLDAVTRVVTWTFTTLDPDTGLPPADPTVGFLPPNATSPEGEGAVSFSVRPLGAATTGTTITAQATIVFDTNDAIDTNVDVVIIDRTAPSAAPTAPATSTNPVTVQLGVTDQGAGVATSDVWVSRNGGLFELVADDVVGSTFAFTGIVGSTYRFAVRPTDRVGLVGGLGGPSAPVTVVAAGGGGGGGGGGTVPPKGAAIVSLVPGRLLDSRPAPAGETVDGLFRGAGVRPGGSVTEVRVTGRGGVPANAAAVVLNVTAIRPVEGGFVTVFPCGQPRPNASNLNYAAGQVVANAVVAKVGAGGKVCVYTFAATHLAVDVNGYVPSG